MERHARGIHETGSLAEHWLLQLLGEAVEAEADHRDEELGDDKADEADDGHVVELGPPTDRGRGVEGEEVPCGHRLDLEAYNRGVQHAVAWHGVL